MIKNGTYIHTLYYTTTTNSHVYVCRGGYVRDRPDAGALMNASLIWYAADVYMYTCVIHQSTIHTYSLTIACLQSAGIARHTNHTYILSKQHHRVLLFWERMHIHTYIHLFCSNILSGVRLALRSSAICIPLPSLVCTCIHTFVSAFIHWYIHSLVFCQLVRS
jgi:hypothetical protein